MAPSRKKNVKKPVDTRQTMEDWDIIFKGPVLRTAWPQGHDGYYYRTFGDIHRIGCLSYESYFNDGNGDNTANAQLHDRVRGLVREAWMDRRRRVNEETMRDDTESEIFSRFKKEIKCSDCRNYMWLPRYSAQPADPAEAAKLQRARVRRIICQCGPIQRSWDGFEDPGETFLFIFNRGEVIKHDESEAKILDKLGVAARHPDKVYGINTTSKVHHYARAMNKINHSPFGHPQLIYPFLIVEAKSEKGSKGFEAIEVQTAFPIRRFLKLQQDLCRESGVKMDPLVWFMCCQGDEWRLAACVVNNDKYEIYDLWMGRILSPDGAMQLLLIVDYLCDWAREVHRFDVLRCLSRGEQISNDRTRVGQTTNGRRSPTYDSRVSAQGSQEANLANEREDGQKSREISSLPLNEPTSADLQMNEALEISSDSGSSTYDLDTRFTNDEQPQQQRSMQPPLVSNHPWLHWMDVSEREWPWSKDAAVRHANMVLFKYSYVKLPEELEPLLSCLHQLRPGFQVKIVAETILSMFVHRNSMALTSHDIDHVRNAWIKTHQEMSEDLDELMRVVMHVRCFFQPDAHQVVRSLVCIACTQKALKTLHTITNRPGNPPQEWRDLFENRSPIPIAPIQAIHSLTGKDSLLTSLAPLCGILLYEQSDAGGSYFLGAIGDGAGQGIFSNASATGTTPQKHNQLSITKTPFYCCSILLEVLFKPIPREFPWLRQQHSLRSTEASLIWLSSRTAPGTLSQSYKRWCLMALKETDLEDTNEVSTILRDAAHGAHAQIIHVSNYGEPDMEITLLDSIPITEHAFLLSWIASLARAHGSQNPSLT